MKKKIISVSMQWYKSDLKLMAQDLNINFLEVYNNMTKR